MMKCQYSYQLIASIIEIFSNFTSLCHPEPFDFAQGKLRSTEAEGSLVAWMFLSETRDLPTGRQVPPLLPATAGSVGLPAGRQE